MSAFTYRSLVVTPYTLDALNALYAEGWEPFVQCAMASAVASGHPIIPHALVTLRKPNPTV